MYLYGASGHAKVIIEILEACGEQIEGLFDDNESVTSLLGYPVSSFVAREGNKLIISIGNNEIRKRIPNFQMTYRIDPIKQGIAESWPNSLDDSCAREEWGWKPQWDLSAMTDDMLEAIRKKNL